MSPLLIRVQTALGQAKPSQAKPTHCGCHASSVRIGSVSWPNENVWLARLLLDYFYFPLSLSIFGMWWETQIYCASNYLKHTRTHTHANSFERRCIYKYRRYCRKDTVSLPLVGLPVSVCWQHLMANVSGNEASNKTLLEGVSLLVGLEMSIKTSRFVFFRLKATVMKGINCLFYSTN